MTLGTQAGIGVGLRLLQALVTLQMASGQVLPAWYLNTRVQTGAVRGSPEAGRDFVQAFSSPSTSAPPSFAGWVSGNSPVHLPAGNRGQYSSVGSNNVWNLNGKEPLSGLGPAPAPSGSNPPSQTANAGTFVQRPGFEQTASGSVPFVISIHFATDSRWTSGSAEIIPAASRPSGGPLGQSLSSAASATRPGMAGASAAAARGSAVYEKKDTLRVWTVSPSLRLAGGLAPSQPGASSWSAQSQPTALSAMAETGARKRRDRLQLVDGPYQSDSLSSDPRFESAASPWTQRRLTSPSELSSLPGSVPSRTSSSKIDGAVQPYPSHPANAVSNGQWSSGSRSKAPLTYGPNPFQRATSFDGIPSGFSWSFGTNRRPEMAGQQQTSRKISAFSILGSYQDARVQQNSPPYKASRTSRENDVVSAHGQNISQPVIQDNITSGIRFYWPPADTNNSHSSLSRPLRSQHLVSQQRQHTQEAAAPTFQSQPDGPEGRGVFRPPMSEQRQELAAPFSDPGRHFLFILLAAPRQTDRKGPPKVTGRPLFSKPNHSTSVEERSVADATEANLSSASPLTGKAEQSLSTPVTAQQLLDLRSENSTPAVAMGFNRVGSFVTDGDSRTNSSQSSSLDTGGSLEAERPSNGSYN